MRGLADSSPHGREHSAPCQNLNLRAGPFGLRSDRSPWIRSAGGPFIRVALSFTLIFGSLSAALSSSGGAETRD